MELGRRGIEINMPVRAKSRCGRQSLSRLVMMIVGKHGAAGLVERSHPWRDGNLFVFPDWLPIGLKDRLTYRKDFLMRCGEREQGLLARERIRTAST